MPTHHILIYGSYGYTGRLIVEECKARNLNVLLSGRDAGKLEIQSQRTGYPFEPADVNDHDTLVALLRKAALVIHCAGPFRYTAKQMVEACLDAQTHYTDITGEYEVFEMMMALDARAKERKILLMPGVGFDVVPSDCLAVRLKKRLPTATHLQLGFTTAKGGISKGTAKTAIEGMGHGTTIRQDGKLVTIPLGDKSLEIDFGTFKTAALCIPWGDIVTAWRSTGISNIEVYTGVRSSTIRYARLSRWINWLLRFRFIKNYFIKQIDRRPDGPDEKKRDEGRSYLWGRVWDYNGNTAELRLETLNGYKLTAKTSSLIAEHILITEVIPGYSTPAAYFQDDFILKVSGSRFY